MKNCTLASHLISLRDAYRKKTSSGSTTESFGEVANTDTWDNVSWNSSYSLAVGTDILGTAARTAFHGVAARNTDFTVSDPSYKLNSYAICLYFAGGFTLELAHKMYISTSIYLTNKETYTAKGGTCTYSANENYNPSGNKLSTDGTSLFEYDYASPYALVVYFHQSAFASLYTGQKPWEMKLYIFDNTGTNVYSCTSKIYIGVNANAKNMPMQTDIKLSFNSRQYVQSVAIYSNLSVTNSDDTKILGTTRPIFTLSSNTTSRLDMVIPISVQNSSVTDVGLDAIRKVCGADNTKSQYLSFTFKSALSGYDPVLWLSDDSEQKVYDVEVPTSYTNITFDSGVDIPFKLTDTATTACTANSALPQSVSDFSELSKYYPYPVLSVYNKTYTSVSKIVVNQLKVATVKIASNSNIEPLEVYTASKQVYQKKFTLTFNADGCSFNQYFDPDNDKLAFDYDNLPNINLPDPDSSRRTIAIYGFPCGYTTTSKFPIRYKDNIRYYIPNSSEDFTVSGDIDTLAYNS